MRRLLSHYRIRARPTENPFRDWSSLPDHALLAIKRHKEKSKAYWHWVVFVRDTNGACVLDSKKGLKKNQRTDFGRIRPQWFIEIMQ